MRVPENECVCVSRVYTFDPRLGHQHHPGGVGGQRAGGAVLVRVVRRARAHRRLRARPPDQLYRTKHYSLRPPLYCGSTEKLILSHEIPNTPIDLLNPCCLN